jgi:arginyl-tRNA synthetase
VDAARYSLVRTSYTQPLEIDLDLLARHSNDNPVYYVQYASARGANVDRNAAAAGISREGADFSLLDLPDDEAVLALLAQYPQVVTKAGNLREPHRVAHYLETLAGAYHTWYAKERVVPIGEREQGEGDDSAKNPSPACSAARLRLNDAVRQIVANGLGLLGVTAPDRM